MQREQTNVVYNGAAVIITCVATLTWTGGWDDHRVKATTTTTTTTTTTITTTTTTTTNTTTTSVISAC